MVVEHPDLAALCSALIDLANERGGPDNITVIAARFEGEALPEPGEAEGVGYQVYELPGAETESVDLGSPPTHEPEPAPDLPAPASAAPVATEPAAERPRSLLLFAALFALLAFLLTLLL